MRGKYILPQFAPRSSSIQHKNKISISKNIIGFHVTRNSNYSYSIISSVINQSYFHLREPPDSFKLQTV